MSALLASLQLVGQTGADVTPHLAQTPEPGGVPPVDTMSTGESVAFWILGPLALAGGLGMVFARNAVHSVLWLVLTMFSLGIMYMAQQAQFLGFAQIIVYTGAIMMLFLFVLMLIGRDASDSIVETLRGQRMAAAVVGIAFAVLVVSMLSRALTEVDPIGLAAVHRANGNIATIGELLFTDYLLGFELTAALLMTGAIAGMVLANTDRGLTRRSQREMVEARFRGEHDRPSSPLPGPGVFATSNSVATPALLPDGSVAPESVSELINPRERTSLAVDEAVVAGVLPGPTARALLPAEPEADGDQADVTSDAPNGTNVTSAQSEPAEHGDEEGGR